MVIRHDQPNPFEEGYNAFSLGFSILDNPYQPDDIEFEEWDDGFQAAMDNDEGEENHL